MRSAIAENTKSIIKDKGLKQKAVGEMAGYNPKTFNNMLNGRKIISDIDVVNIANALGVSPNALFGNNPQAS